MLNKSSKISILEESVSRRIAAGEVIDRPAAAVRELLDNAIDSGATNITLVLQNGGTSEIRVTDNGLGMDESDLKICWKPHATSKIQILDDLNNLSTLGFRGEALASLAICSRLEITSSQQQFSAKLSIHGGKLINFKETPAKLGTTVSVKELFFNMPARKNFLKSIRAELNQCRQVFLEKTIAHPNISFRLLHNNKLLLFLPESSLKQRIMGAYPNLAPEQAWLVTEGFNKECKLNIVHCQAEIFRKDRKYIQIFANRRKIDQFSLVHSVVNAYETLMPGGNYPIAFVFLEIIPERIDFNIHPAKKEVKIHDLPTIHHLIKSSIESNWNSKYKFNQKKNYQAKSFISNIPKSINYQYQDNTLKLDRFIDISNDYRKNNDKIIDTFEKKSTSYIAESVIKNIRYIGQTLGVFLLAEFDDSLFIIDQHAVHERILYDKLCLSKPKPEQLVIPRVLHIEKSVNIMLEPRQKQLIELGIIIEKKSTSEWELTALPVIAKKYENEIIELLETGNIDPQSLKKEFWANIACKAAVKDQTILDNDAAEKLVRQTFGINPPRCPHGRPLWFNLSKKELFELVGRT